MPQQDCVADAGGGLKGVDVVAGTREADDPELHRAFGSSAPAGLPIESAPADSAISQSSISGLVSRRSHIAGKPPDRRRRARSAGRRARCARRRSRAPVAPLHRLALRIEDSRLGRTRTRPSSRSLQPGVERVAGDPLYASMYFSRVRCTTSSGISGAGGLRSQPVEDAQSRTNCLSSSAASARARTGRLARSARSPACTLVAERQLPVLVEAELELGVGQDDPALRACSAAAL